MTPSAAGGVGMMKRPNVLTLNDRSIRGISSINSPLKNEVMEEDKSIDTTFELGKEINKV